MDFQCAAFPDFKMHVSLFPLASPDSSTDDIERRKAKLMDIVRLHPDSITMINAKHVSVINLIANPVVGRKHNAHQHCCI